MGLNDVLYADFTHSIQQLILRFNHSSFHIIIVIHGVTYVNYSRTDFVLDCCIYFFSIMQETTMLDPICAH